MIEMSTPPIEPPYRTWTKPKWQRFIRRYHEDGHIAVRLYPWNWDADDALREVVGQPLTTPVCGNWYLVPRELLPAIAEQLGDNAFRLKARALAEES